MRTPVLVLVAAALGGLAAAGGFLAHRALSPPPANAAPPAASLPVDAPSELARPDFSLPDVDGRVRHVGEWRGKVLVVNFWATWCPPCLEEIPVFNALQASHATRGLQFLGIAIDEVENVRRFAVEHAMAYPTLHGQLDAIAVGKALGNRVGALPYTVFLDRDGEIVDTHAGPLDRETTLGKVEKLL